MRLLPIKCQWLLFVCLTTLVPTLHGQQTYNYVPPRPHVIAYEIEAYHDHLAVAGSESGLVFRCRVPSLEYLSPSGQSLWNASYPDFGYSRYTAVKISPEGRIFAAGDWQVGDDFLTLEDGLILAEYDTTGQLIWNRKHPLLFIYTDKTHLSLFPNGQMAVAANNHLLLLTDQGDILEDWTDFVDIQYLEVLNDSLVALIDEHILAVYNIHTGQSEWHTFDAVDPTQVVCHGGRVWWARANQWRVFNPAQDNVSVPQGMAPEGYFPRSDGDHISFLSQPTPDLNFIWAYTPQTNTTALTGQLELGYRNITDWTPDEETPFVAGQEQQTDATLKASYIGRGDQNDFAINALHDAGISNLAATILDIDTTNQWGPTRYEIILTLDLAISIRNYGPSPLYDVVVASYQRGSFNCSEARDFFNFQFPDGIAPGTDTTLYVTVTPFAVIDPNGISFSFSPNAYCMFTMSPNQQMDANVSNDDFCLTLVGTQEPVAALADLKIFPNPAGEVLHLSSETPLESLQIFDWQGRLLLNFQSLEIQSGPLQLNALPAGAYWIRITTSEGQSIHQKLIKQ